MLPLGTSLHARPRVAGAREEEILDATLELLAVVGYDKLTMDAIASAARASKATLYRRWSSKVDLVIEALGRMKAGEAVPDTGSLRGDLLAVSCDSGGVTDEFSLAVMGSIVTALQYDPEFAVAFRERVIASAADRQRAIFRHAIDRGELSPDIDIDSLFPIIPAICLYHVFVLGEQIDSQAVRRIVDDVLLPAVEHHARRLREVPT